MMDDKIHAPPKVLLTYKIWDRAHESKLLGLFFIFHPKERNKDASETFFIIRRLLSWLTVEIPERERTTMDRM